MSQKSSEKVHVVTLGNFMNNFLATRVFAKHKICYLVPNHSLFYNISLSCKYCSIKELLNRLVKANNFLMLDNYKGNE